MDALFFQPGGSFCHVGTHGSIPPGGTDAEMGRLHPTAYEMLQFFHHSGMSLRINAALAASKERTQAHRFPFVTLEVASSFFQCAQAAYAGAYIVCPEACDNRDLFHLAPSTFDPSGK